MNLKHLSDTNLLQATEALDQKERDVFTALLHHLREIERRRLFSALGYTSLFDYLVRHLKSSESTANRRISSMRLMRDLPEIEEKITSGELSASNLVLAQALFTKEKKAGREFTCERKAEVLEKLENQSTREAQKIVGAINPEMKKAKSFDFDSIEDEVLRAKLLHVKGLFAHSAPNMNLTELLYKLCDQEIGRKSQPIRRQNAPPTLEVDLSEAEVRRQVWARDQSKCIKCGSTHAIQEEHRIPESVGGKYTVENICLLCRSCNQRAAIEFFGDSKMSRYLKSPRVAYSS